MKISSSNLREVAEAVMRRIAYQGPMAVFVSPDRIVHTMAPEDERLGERPTRELVGMYIRDCPIDVIVGDLHERLLELGA